MSKISKSRLVLMTIVTLWLVEGAEIRAESRDDTQKRMFVARLTREARISAAHVARSHGARASVRKVEGSQLTRSLIDASQSSPSSVAHASVATVLVANSNLGVVAATVVTPSGFGSGRDAFVETLYAEILGRGPIQSELDYWARILAGGVHANVVAEDIWKSQEHKSLVRSGDAPNIPLNTAYRHAYAVGLANCQKLLDRERRRSGLD
jgi:hypothetical protein